jgi:hypothetical protein
MRRISTWLADNLFVEGVTPSQALWHVAGSCSYILLAAVSLIFGFGILYVGLTGCVGLTLFVFETMKLFSGAEVNRKVVSDSAAIDGLYSTWCMVTAVTLWYLPPAVLTLALPYAREYFSPVIGENRAVKADAVLSMILIAMTLVKLCELI